MSLQLLGHIELPRSTKSGGFDHAAVHRASGRIYVAHPANDALEVIDGGCDRHSHSIQGLTGVAGALTSASVKKFTPSCPKRIAPPFTPPKVRAL